MEMDVAKIIGFFAEILALYYTLKPLLKENLSKWTSLSIILIMAGLGAGALNEIVEFTATVLVPETGVGGYNNTMWDIVFNTLGGIAGAVYLRLREKSPAQ